MTAIIIIKNSNREQDDSSPCSRFIHLQHHEISVIPEAGSRIELHAHVGCRDLDRAASLHFRMILRKTDSGRIAFALSAPDLRRVESLVDLPDLQLSVDIGLADRVDPAAAAVD